MTIIVPALNEEQYIDATLDRVALAVEEARSDHGCEFQVIVVDNDSTDGTADRARAREATVIKESVRNIGRARNRGAELATGDLLFFLDADTLVPPTLFSQIIRVMENASCIGGAVDIDYKPSHAIIRWYLSFWRVIGKLFGMAQGAAQFCSREAFASLAGYDEKIFMGEDVDFYWRLGRYARETHKGVCFIDEIKVTSSTRRFDQWPTWKTLLWTNPFVGALFRRNPKVWSGWYRNVPR